MELTKDYENVIKELLNFWKSRGLRKYHFEVIKNKMFIKDRLLGIYRKNIDMFEIEYFYEAILNYSIVIKNKQLYWYKYIWLFWDFLERGYEKFTNEAMPLENFRINQKQINIGDNFGR